MIVNLKLLLLIIICIFCNFVVYASESFTNIIKENNINLIKDFDSDFSIIESGAENLNYLNYNINKIFPYKKNISSSTLANNKYIYKFYFHNDINKLFLAKSINNSININIVVDKKQIININEKSIVIDLKGKVFEVIIFSDYEISINSALNSLKLIQLNKIGFNEFQLKKENKIITLSNHVDVSTQSIIKTPDLLTINNSKLYMYYYLFLFMIIILYFIDKCLNTKTNSFMSLIKSRISSLFKLKIIIRYEYVINFIIAVSFLYCLSQIFVYGVLLFTCLLVSKLLIHFLGISNLIRTLFILIGLTGPIVFIDKFIFKSMMGIEIILLILTLSIYKTNQSNL
jgi:hypothetical protein